jgi:hypothetical protein
MDNSTPSGRSGNGVKPAVGSDEWHKVRKDNHKEGKFGFPDVQVPILMRLS